MTVVTVASQAPTADYFCFEAFKKSLERYNCTPVILGWQEEWKGLMTKPHKYLEWLRKHPLPNEPIILCDAWDVVFAADPEKIAKEFKCQICNIAENVSGVRLVAQYPEIIWNAEKNLFPLSDMKFSDTNSSYRYLNSGFAVGYPTAFIRMFEWINLDQIGFDREVPNGTKIEPNDQFEIQFAFIESGIPMAIDSGCEICQTLHGVEENELDFTQDKIYNRETGSYPLVFHLNGYKEKWKDKILTKLNL